MKISAIAALDNKRAIGKNNDLLFKIPEDFARMKRLTLGHPIIMGRKTFESIGRVLPNRLNIVITHNSTRNDTSHTNLVFVSSLNEALMIAERAEDDRIKVDKQNTKYKILNTNSEVFIFGGGQIFLEALPKIDRLYLTLVEGYFQGDTFFPDYSEFTKVIEKEEHTDWDYPYTFLILEK